MTRVASSRNIFAAVRRKETSMADKSTVNRIGRFRRKSVVCVLVLFTLLAGLMALTTLSAAAAIQPCAADAATLHLWHMDETSTPCSDSAPGGTNLTHMIGGATLGNASYSSSAVNFTNCISFGTLATPAAVIFPSGSGNVGNAIPFTYAGADGAFTFEALVQVGFNPTNNYSARNQPFQIMDCDSDSAVRVFQLRLDPVGITANGGMGVVGIEFINGTTSIAVAPIPTNGPDAIVSNAWYHVAVTFNGMPNTTSNLLFYWTLVDPTRTNADCIYGTNMASDLPGTSTTTTVFSLGNSARNPSGGTGADVMNFLGNIDEVRISSVARPAGGMLFVSTNIVITSQPSPASQIVGTGQTVSYSVTASGTPLNFQWRLNGSPLTNATSNTFAIPDAQPMNSGNYDVLVTNNFYAVTSSVASLTVTNLAILAQPVGVAAAAGGTATFTVTAIGAQPLLYQWHGPSGPVAGATNSELIFAPVDSSEAGNYFAVVTNYLGSITSAVVALTVSAVNGPAVTLTPVFDGTNVASSGYAYAGSSSINTVSFISSGLMTVSNQQFFAYYGQHQTNPAYAYNGTIWIARRAIGAYVWQIFRTTFTPDNITDGHDVVAFGIDGSNYMHLSWGMHNATPIHYARSIAPVTGTNTIAFGPDLGTMTGNSTIEEEATYPQFLTLPDGDLLFLYRVGGPGGGSGGGDTCLNRWSLAAQTWTNVNGNAQFIKGYWSSAINYNAYPNMPCLDASGNLYLAWTWRETPAYESNHDLNYAQSTNGGVSWQRYDGTTYDLPICETNNGGSDPNEFSTPIVSIPQNYSLINQAGMCLDASNNPVLATWWAPGSPTNYQRQYMVVFPDTNGVWQTRQISHRTNDPPGTEELDGAVRDLGRPVVVCDKQDRILVLYRDNFGSNGLTVACSLPYAMDPQRTNWTTFNLTTDNLGNYEPVIDLARWQRDNVLDIVCQASDGEGYSAPANNASPIGVLEWNEAAYFNYAPTLQMNLANQNQNAALAWNTQPGWGFQVQSSTNLVNWNAVTSLNSAPTSLSGEGGFLPLQSVQTNGTAGPLQFWRLQVQEGGF
jgi:hypothetical protein